MHDWKRHCYEMSVHDIDDAMRRWQDRFSVLEAIDPVSDFWGGIFIYVNLPILFMIV